MTGYKVFATISGRRVYTDKTYRSREKAQAYANETNSYRKGANARVVKGVAKKSKLKVRRRSRLRTYFGLP